MIAYAEYDGRAVALWDRDIANATGFYIEAEFRYDLVLDKPLLKTDPETRLVLGWSDDKARAGKLFEEEAGRLRDG